MKGLYHLLAAEGLTNTHSEPLSPRHPIDHNPALWYLEYDAMVRK